MLPPGNKPPVIPKKLVVFTLNLILGLAFSQLIPEWLSKSQYHGWTEFVAFFTMTCLSFIMINVGYEFDMDKSQPKKYINDYLVAMTAAGFPWIAVAFWFRYAVPSPLPWGEALLAGRFAAPTSAGILFSMLEAAGMKETWLFQKARTLAIFDDLDTVLLMIPLKVILVGFKWELSIELLAVFGLLVLAWKKLHEITIPCSWHWTILYAFIVSCLCEAIAYSSSHDGVPMEAVHLEVLMPAFVIGCVVRNPHHEAHEIHENTHEDEKANVTRFEKERMKNATAEPGMLGRRRSHNVDAFDQSCVHTAAALHEAKQAEDCEEKVADIISAFFMVLVGLSMPRLFGGDACDADAADGHRRMMGTGLVSGVIRRFLPEVDPEDKESADRILDGENGDESLGIDELAFHVFCVSLLMIAGKMFPIVCYKGEANLKTRLALCLGMCPRGEVGAGVIVISIAFGICGQCITIAVICLALNLILSSAFIMGVKVLAGESVEKEAEEASEMDGLVDDESVEHNGV